MIKDWSITDNSYPMTRAMIAALQQTKHGEPARWEKFFRALHAMMIKQSGVDALVQDSERLNQRTSLPLVVLLAHTYT